MLVKGPNGNTLFLPAAGQCDNDLYNVGNKGYYWSSTVATEYPDYAWGMEFEMEYEISSVDAVDEEFRADGCVVRAVRVSQK